MIGSWGGSPRFSASLGHPGGDLFLGGVVARVGVGAAGVGGRGRDVGRTAARTARPRRAGRARRRTRPRPAARGRRGVDRADRRRPGRRVALDADELDVGLARVPGHGHDRVLVVALQRGELAVLDVAGDEPDVPVGAEVLSVAPVVGDDVARTRVLGADDLEVVLAGLGVLHPGLDRRPAAARHLVAGLLQRPGHEARAPRVARADPGRLQVLVDLGAGVDALLVDALGELALGDLQRRGAEAARAARRRRRGVGHDGRHGARRDRARRPGRGLHEGKLVASLGPLAASSAVTALKEASRRAWPSAPRRRRRRRRAGRARRRPTPRARPAWRRPGAGGGAGRRRRRRRRRAASSRGRSRS